MIQIDLPPLVKRLNLFSPPGAGDGPPLTCMSQQAAEITVSHVLIQMLAMPRSDLRVITPPGRYWHGRVAPGADGRETTPTRPFCGQLPGVFPDAG